MRVNNTLIMGVLAVIAGLLVLLLHDALQWIVGIFLIVWGLLTILGKR